MAQPTWNTPAGSLGTYPSLEAMLPTVQLSASSGVLDPLVTYKIISGSLPAGVTMTVTGLISGIPDIVPKPTDYSFVVRATNTQNEIRDRSFLLSISGYAGPKFQFQSGSLFAINDSVWVERYVPYINFYSSNPIKISIVQGVLPPGLEINQDGLIRGYPDIPYININFQQTLTIATVTTAVTNVITVSSTVGFAFGRPVVFTGVTFGNIIAGKTYYIKDIISDSECTISLTQFGPEVYLTSATGFMTATLPSTTLGQPTAKTYTFDLLLESPLGNDLKSYYITIINQNLPLVRGGPGLPYFTRLPTILNTQPKYFYIPNDDPYYAYYLFPNDARTNTYPTSTPALMGDFESGNYISFKIIGYTFDNFNIKYQFVGLPAGLVGDENTGWVYGTPILNSDTIGNYSFTVRTYKDTNPNIQSGLFYFSLNIYKNITSTVVWITPSTLGTLFNTQVSTKYVKAQGDVELEYRLVSGSLPPNLDLKLDGQITGIVANQPTSEILSLNTKTTFTFSIQAYSPQFPLVNSTKTFSLIVDTVYDNPMDTLYITASPSVNDRYLIDSLLTNTTIIPNDYVYRLTDSNFGKAKNVTYEHQYGVTASDIEKYLASEQEHFYWRKITLGTIETAIARNENNEIIYEVVYSKIIDDLVNSKGESVNYEIVWSEPISLNLGPWITSETNIYTSFTNINNEQFYTSLTPGSALVFFPNSLQNMNKQIAETIGQQYDSRILPQWMTSQQLDGNTLGFTRAWVICYTKPGYSKIVKNNIETQWLNQYGEVNKLNQINFTLDRFSVDKSLTYNYDNFFTPPAWTGLPSGTPVPDPKNSKDFYVLFPRKTILPDEPQL